MHKLTLALAIFAAAGCSTDTVSVEYQSTLWSETRGLVLHEGGIGHAAMWDTTCEFDATTGELTLDYDLPSDDETIHDVRDGMVIGRSDMGVHFIDGAGYQEALDVDMVGVHDVRLIDGGVVALRDHTDGCAVEWAHSGGRTVTTIGDQWCDSAAAFTADPVSGKAFVTLRGDVIGVDDDGAEVLFSGADQVHWDPTYNRLYAGMTGSGTVAALDIDGGVEWEIDLGSSLHDLDDMGTFGGVAVMTGEGANGDLLVLSGEDGSERASIKTPGRADIVVSEDGRTLGIVEEWEVYFYDVREGRNPPTITTNLPNDSIFSD
jgi:hypothetical protein